MRFLFLIMLFPISYEAGAQNSFNCSDSIEYNVSLKKRSVFPDKKGMLTMDSFIKKLKNYPDCKIQVESYGQESEKMLQASWDKSAFVIKYLRKNGIDSARFVFMYGHENGDFQTVKISLTSDEGPAWIFAPIPCYSYLKLTPKRCKEAH